MSEGVIVRVKIYGPGRDPDREYRFYAPWYENGREPMYVVEQVDDGMLRIIDRHHDDRVICIPAEMVAHLGEICRVVTEPKFEPIDTAG